MRGVLLADIHPMLVPFPLVLLIVAAVCDGISYISHQRFFVRMASWVLSLAVCTTVLTVLSGYLTQSLSWAPCRS
ncbi:MAG: hypothetical protein M1294_02030 [Firmicutes bacterium]|nr:hypothetical protein [Bacillota bacterium]